MAKKKQLIYEVVKEDDSVWAVKTQLTKNGHWYTAAETFCIPGRLDAKEMAETIAQCLNHRERVLNTPPIKPGPPFGQPKPK